MRVLHVTPCFERAWAYGGIPRVVGALSRAFAARGHEVEVVTTDAFDAHARLSPEPARDPRDPVTIRVFRNVSNAAAYHLQLYLPRGMSDHLAGQVSGFDVVHIHACHNLPAALAARHARSRGVPYVVQPNGTAGRIERRRLAKRVFDAVFARDLLAGAAVVLAVSAAERRDLVRLGVNASRIEVLANPIDLAEHATPACGERFRARFGIASDTPVVLFLGRMTPRKRLDVVVRAFAAAGVAGARLVLAGNDGGALAQALRCARQLGVEKAVVVTGLLGGPARLDALAAASVVVYPGRDEVFGLVAAEALLQGVPVLVAGDSGCGELVREVGGGEVIAQGDVGGFAAGISRMLATSEAARATAREGATRVRELFGAEVIARDLEAIYLRRLPRLRATAVA